MGIEQGRHTERQTIALKMLRENIPLETIAQITGLSISELEGFANEHLQQLQSNSHSERA